FSRSHRGGGLLMRAPAALLFALSLLSSWLVPAAATNAQEDAPHDVALDGPYPVLYDVRVVPSEKVAYVKVILSKNARDVTRVTFITDPERHTDFDGDGDISIEGREVSWEPPKSGGELRYTFRIDHLRDAQRYDARVSSTWALFRGDDLVPPARVSTADGAL